NAAQSTFFDDKAILYCKSGVLEALIVVGITVKPGEKVGVAVGCQDAVALLGEPSVVDPPIALQHGVGRGGKLVLIPDAIGRVGQDQGNSPIREFSHQVQAVTLKNLIDVVFRKGATHTAAPIPSGTLIPPSILAPSPGAWLS